ncbi:MAG: RNA polymerase sigma factor RpoE [Magnetococcales bacterium]|nr:RNA polymerase sigma factor RpoE [Magnetococcales bacterium]
MSEADILLVEQVKAGDKKAFEVLVRKYQSRIAAVIARSVNDPWKVQDLTQEAFLKAYRALGSFRGDSAFYTWLYRIAINTAKNYLTSNDRDIPMAELDLENEEDLSPLLQVFDNPEKQLLRAEMMRALDKAINGLTPAMQQAIRLRDVEGLSYERIAELMDCPVGTVRSRIFRGRQEIMDQLKRYFNDGVLEGLS